MKARKIPVLVSKTETKWQNFSLSSRRLRLGGKILVLVSKHEIERKKISIPSRTRDWKTDILDPVSKVETGLSLDTEWSLRPELGSTLSNPPKNLGMCRTPPFFGNDSILRAPISETPPSGHIFYCRFFRSLSGKVRAEWKYTKYTT